MIKIPCSVLRITPRLAFFLVQPKINATIDYLTLIMSKKRRTVTKSRKDIVQEVNEPSLLDLMQQQDTLQQALPDSQSDSDAIRVMGQLSQTCHTLHSLFRKQLSAKIFLQHVVRGEKKAVEASLLRNPHLLLEKMKVTDEAGRQIVGTAYQLALGAKDVSPFPNEFEEMAEMLVRYFRKLPNSEEEMAKQYAQQFPKGFEVQEAARRKQDLEALTTVFTAIKNATTMAAANDAVKSFQLYLKQQIERVITTGYHFNDMLFAEALALYESHCDAYGGMNSKKNNLAAVKVLGGIQRYFTANLAQAVCGGLQAVVTQKQPLTRSTKFRDGYRYNFFDSQLGERYYAYSFIGAPFFMCRIGGNYLGTWAGFSRQYALLISNKCDSLGKHVPQQPCTKKHWCAIS